MAGNDGREVPRTSNAGPRCGARGCRCAVVQAVPRGLGLRTRMAVDETGAAGRYLLGDSPAEIRHLVEQAEVYALEASELFDLIGVGPEIAAIDVGCGVMGVLHLLAERAGPHGRVVGLDREARMVEHRRRLAEQRGLAVEFIEADATTSGLPDNAFDLVHARTLLLNVSNSAEIVAEMTRIARPGGVVASQEPDAAA